MKITITGRKVSLHDSFKERVEKKLKKFGRMFGEDASASVTVTVEKRRQTVEVTIRTADGMVYRSEQTAPEMNDALDEVVNALGRQIRKNKCKLEKKIRAVGAIDEFLAQETEEASAEEEAEGDYKIERIKHFALKPLLVEEAILQMNMIGHQFFMFQNMETGDVNVVYVRKDGTYGLLEPAEE